MGILGIQGHAELPAGSVEAPTQLAQESRDVLCPQTLPGSAVEGLLARVLAIAAPELLDHDVVVAEFLLEAGGEVLGIGVEGHAIVAGADDALGDLPGQGLADLRVGQLEGAGLAPDDIAVDGGPLRVLDAEPLLDGGRPLPFGRVGLGLAALIEEGRSAPDRHAAAMGLLDREA